jgi:hypothetical protein
MAAFCTITELGETRPWALLRVVGGLYERWAPHLGWVDSPFFGTYFAGTDPGARPVSEAEAEKLKSDPVIAAHAGSAELGRRRS